MVVRKALGITGLAQATTFILGLINVVVVSRLLKPEEIGIYSVSVSILGFAHIFREFGVGQYLVHASSVSRERYRAAFTVALLTSWLIALVLVAIREPMARLYAHAGISQVLLLLAANFVILPIGTPVLSMLRRDLQFDKIALIDIVATLVHVGVTISAAFLGQSYLSMAWGSIAMTLTRMVMVNMLRPGETFLLPTLKGLREVVRFGTTSSTAAVIKELGSAAPDMIFGRTLGFQAVALFSRGTGLHGMAVDRVNAIVRSVYFSTFAADLRNGQPPAALYGRATSYLLAVTAPTLAVLAILSRPLILFVFGPQWERSVLVAQIVCAGSLLVAPYSLYGLSLIAAGKVSTYLRAEAMTQSVRVAVLLCSLWLPFETVVALLPLAYAMEAAVSQRALRLTFGLGARSLWSQVWRALALVPFAATGPAVVMFWSRQPGIMQDRHLATLIAAGALAVAGWLWGLVVTAHPLRGELSRLLERLPRWR